jgi:hypothetical protein
MSDCHKPSLRAAIVLALASFAPNAFAYLDPSTGSMILSAIVGLFATLGLALKTYWYKFKSLITGGRSNAVRETPEDELDNNCADR